MYYPLVLYFSSLSYHIVEDMVRDVRPLAAAKAVIAALNHLLRKIPLGVHPLTNHIKLLARNKSNISKYKRQAKRLTSLYLCFKTRQNAAQW